MLVKDLLSYLQKIPEHYRVTMVIPITEDVPFLIDLELDDIQANSVRGLLEIDGSIPDEAVDELELLMHSDDELQPGDAVVYSASEQYMTTAERMAIRGMSLVKPSAM